MTAATDGDQAKRPPEARHFAHNAAIIGAGTLLSRLLGMARETMIAALFPAAATDAFFIAWRIPNTLRSLLADGALSTGFVPEITDSLSRDGREKTRDFVARLRGVSLVVLSATTLLGILFARPILAVSTGDFGGDTARFELCVRLLRVLFPYIFFMGTAAVGMAVLNSLKRFTATSLAPGLLNVAFLACTLALIPACDRAHLPRIYALAAGGLVGGALQVLALVPSLRREKMYPRPVVDFRAPRVVNVGRLLLPTTLGFAIYQIDVLFSNRFLAGLPVGGASYFNYAQRLADIPQGLFVLALSSATLPEMARLFAEDKPAAASQVYAESMRLAGFVAVPATVLFACYGEALVPLVYRYGRFAGGAGVHEVVRSLRWQALNIALLAYVRQTTAIYYAKKLTRVPVLVSGVDFLAFVALGFALRGPMGHVGVAAAIAGSTVVQLGLLLVFLPRDLTPPWRRVLVSLARVLVASAALGACARLLVHLVRFDRGGLWVRLVAVAGAGALVGVYLLVAWWVRCEEMHTVLRKLRARLSRAPRSRA